MLEASMLVIGDEILGGFITDTNSPWVADRLRHHGVPLSRIQTVPDDIAAIGEALHAELARARPRVILTSGGIGSTPDDLTYEAIAAALDRELVEDAVMAERIAGALDWTRDFGIDVDEAFADHMLRMARIPAGGELLQHSGWAPGVRVDVDGGVDDDGCTVVILPGVPSQFRRIVTEAVEPVLLEGRNEPVEVVEVTHSFPESAMNRCFVQLMEEHPDVKLGSYPGVPMLVRLSGPPDSVVRAAKKVRTYVAELEEDPAGARLARAWSDRFGGIEKDRR